MDHDTAMRIHIAATDNSMDESQKRKVELDTKRIYCRSVNRKNKNW